MRTDLSDLIELCLLSANPALIEIEDEDFVMCDVLDNDIKCRYSSIACILPNTLAYKLIPYCLPTNLIEIPRFDQKAIRKLRKRYGNYPSYYLHFDFTWNNRQYKDASINRIHECGDCRTCYVCISTVDYF